MGNPVVYFEIAGKDVEKLNDFYSSVFGWKMDENPNGGSYMVGDEPDQGIPGHLLPVTEEMGFDNWVTFYIEVDDLQAYLDKVESLGGKTCIPPQVIPGNMGSFAMFLDPSNNYIGIYQMPTTGQA